MNAQIVHFEMDWDVPTRILSQVHRCESDNPEALIAVMRSLLDRRFTGPITLDVSAGRVRSVRWEEKVGAAR